MIQNRNVWTLQACAKGTGPHDGSGNYEVPVESGGNVDAIKGIQRMRVVCIK